MAALTAPIRAVLFDVDGTLYSQRPLRVAMACEMMLASAKTMGRQRPSDARLIMAFRRIREQLRSDDGSGEPLAERQYSAVSDRMGCAPAHVERAVAEWIYRRPLKWLRFCRRAGLSELLAFLAVRGVRRGVFSDYPAHDKLAALGVADCFDLELSAVDREVGAFKPDPRGFHAASMRWKLPAEQILYVGDRLDVDAAGAAAAGMPCALIVSRKPAQRANVFPVADFKELQRVLDPVC